VPLIELDQPLSGVRRFVHHTARVDSHSCPPSRSRCRFYNNYTVHLIYVLFRNIVHAYPGGPLLEAREVRRSSAWLPQSIYSDDAQSLATADIRSGSASGCRNAYLTNRYVYSPEPI
jgi:hypothetical protein